MAQGDPRPSTGRAGFWLIGGLVGLAVVVGLVWLVWLAQVQGQGVARGAERAAQGAPEATGGRGTPPTNPLEALLSLYEAQTGSLYLVDREGRVPGVGRSQEAQGEAPTSRGESAGAGAVLASWSWEPTILVGLGLGVGLYALGWWRARRQGLHLAPWRAVCYGLAMLTVAVALLSPIATFSELFFFMHMIQHLLLMGVAAPLIWLGAPLLPVLWALPFEARRGIGRLFVPGHPVHAVFHFLTAPLVAATIFTVSVALWHLPPFYDAAQGRSFFHDLEHLMFFGGALLYWWPVIHPSGGRRRLSYGMAILYLFPAILEGNAIGALLTLGDEPYYTVYREAPRLWGISALQDQQLAGLIMWVPGGLVYLAAILALLAMLLNTEEQSPRPALERR